MSQELTAVVGDILKYVDIFFIIYLIIYSTFLFVSVVIGSVTLYKRRRQDHLRNTLLNKYYVPISIIVPAHNEEVTVVETVRSLLTLEYNLYEIIVVDDGSKDNTTGVLLDAFDLKRIRRPIQRKVPCNADEAVYESVGHKVRITLVRKKNGGKADALNMGINVAQYPYFICMDADSVLQYDSLQKISSPVLTDENVVAVGGAVRPCNGMSIKNGRVDKYRLPRNVLACMQVLEYDRSFLASRILFDSFNGSLIISGAFGLFKKSTVIDAGGYNRGTMGEDMELVVKLHEYCKINNIPYSIKYATDAICWSQVPERVRDLCKQRKRWHLGLFQTLHAHRDMLDFQTFGPLGYISYMYFLIFELISPFTELFGLFTIILSVLFDFLNFPYMVLFFTIYAVFGSVISLTAFFARIQTIDLKVRFTDVLKAVLLCMFETVVLHFILEFVRAGAFIGYKRKKLSWGKIQRKKIDLK